jgi:hypothetical protein
MPSRRRWRTWVSTVLVRKRDVRAGVAGITQEEAREILKMAAKVSLWCRVTVCVF